MAVNGDAVINISDGEGPDSGSDSQKWESFRQKVSSCSRRYESAVVIPKVPDAYLESYKKSYYPKIVSIGPYHRGRGRRLQAMEEEKNLCLQELLKREGTEIDHCIALMCSLEGEARKCYQEKIKLSIREFAEMMMLDAAFIIVKFLNLKEANPQFNFAFEVPLIKRDMLLLENQLPFFVVRKLFELTMKQSSTRLISHAINFFKDTEETRESNQPEPEMVHHLLHLYQFQYYPEYSNRKPPERLFPFPGATKLEKMGMTFRRAPSESILTDLQFGDDNVMEIPRLLIAEDTVALFLNLIAFEQANLDMGTHFTCYAAFMSNMLNEANDVECLCEKEIIENMLSSPQEVVNLFKSMCDAVAIDLSTSIAHLSTRVNEFSSSGWSILKARMKARPWWSAYFTDPVTLAIALVGGVGIWALTAIQTIYTVYSYYHPKS